MSMALLKIFGKIDKRQSKKLIILFVAFKFSNFEIKKMDGGKENKN